MEVNNRITEHDEPMIGMVSNCEKLNIREEPNPNAKVLGKISANTEILIDGCESTETFYKVCTAAGIEGFCMKKYIRLLI